uniref:hypothetical protein n=1 Tax=Paractinoplanes polyasparticus TaxID=2856853 RepID=UPI001C84695B|nr:hypothetical protein [Actinoplanes polyasparticus]
MSAPTITLFRAAFDKLREGRATVALPDSEGRRVFLFTKRVWSSDRIPAPQPSVVLSDADLDAIEREPQGVPVTDAASTGSWRIRLERPNR